MREARVEAHLVKRVKEAGGRIRKCQWIGRRGAPDRYVMWPGNGERFGCADWIELKRPLTPDAEAHQKREHARLRAAGQSVFVLASIEEVDAYVEMRK